jgi:hypothetical protein
VDGEGSVLHSAKPANHDGGYSVPRAGVCPCGAQRNPHHVKLQQVLDLFPRNVQFVLAQSTVEINSCTT